MTPRTLSVGGRRDAWRILEPHAQRIMPAEASEGRIRLAESLHGFASIDGVYDWRAANGATFPLTTPTGDVRYGAVVSLTSDVPLRSLAHEGFHLHVREGRVRDDELRLFASDDFAHVDGRLGFDRRPLGYDLRNEERGASVTGESANGRAASDIRNAPGVDPHASGRRPPAGLPSHGVERPEVEDFLDRFVDGTVGRRAAKGLPRHDGRRCLTDSDSEDECNPAF